MRQLPQEIIRRKRDRQALAAEEIRDLIQGLSLGEVGDAQAAAFAMAVTLNGMDAGETTVLTLAMRDSGSVLDWSGLPGPVVDKHSTGGVGDKVSLALAPILAACGCFVPMISGRGLGHTGGTLDKLESLAGYEVNPSPERLRAVVREAGCAIVGAGADLAPADARLYAIRDVTATVESLPLITASILSKKLAAGTHALVMDVKTGSGAFMPEIAGATALARSIVDVAGQAGLRCSALITDMSQCLGQAAGNALEVAEVVALLKGEPVDARLRDLVHALGLELLSLAGLDASLDRLQHAVASGEAAEHFARMVHGLGGGDPFAAGALPQAKVRTDCPAPRAGFVQAIDTRKLGLAIVALGGGRSLPGAAIDHTVGLSQVAALGAAVAAGAPLAIVHARSDSDGEAAARRVADAFTIGEQPTPVPPLVHAHLPCPATP